MGANDLWSGQLSEVKHFLEFRTGYPLRTLPVRRCQIDQRDIARAFEYLEKLERRATFLIERSNFAVENEAFGRQQL
jgi:hypothetical protein